MALGVVLHSLLSSVSQSILQLEHSYNVPITRGAQHYICSSSVAMLSYSELRFI